MNTMKRFAKDAKPIKSKTDVARLRRMSDAEIEAGVRADPDAAEFDIDWSKAKLHEPPRKQAISLRLDRDVIEYFRNLGDGYQTKMNAVLRSYMRHKDTSLFLLAILLQSFMKSGCMTGMKNRWRIKKSNGAM